MSFLDEVRAERMKKLELLKKSGMNPYPVSTERDYSVAEIIAKFETLSEEGKEVVLAGRVMALRDTGGLIFFNFNDGTATLQGLLKKDDLDEKIFTLFRDTVDLGDFVQISGTLFVTKRGEKTLQVKNWKMLSKSLRPLPDKWAGLQDVEERFRKRYLDVLMSDEVKERFVLRSKIITELRRILDDAEYLEVETPLLQPIAGGASAKPFVTHHNALDIDLYLRIAPELYLKKLLIGGFPKVYEIGRNFRNEGIDVTHNPEFTMLEFYESFGDAEKQMVFVENMLRALVEKLHITFENGTIDFTKKFVHVSYFDVIKEHTGIKDPASVTLDEIKQRAKELNVPIEKGDSVEKIIDSIYKKTARPKIIQPTFLTDYPANYIPLAKKHEGASGLVDAFQLVIDGVELVKGFSELNDPLDQKERFDTQEKRKKEGDSEAQESDEEYLEAMEYGMPPAGGVGIGIDRLVMLLTNTKNIREVILFPTLRPRTLEIKVSN